MRLHFHIITLILVSAASVHAEKLFLPAHDPEHDIIARRTGYVLKYNQQAEQADWVSYVLTRAEVETHRDRTDDFRPDPDIRTKSATLADYRGSGYDRGHLKPAADSRASEKEMRDSFLMSNMSPQLPEFNRGIWKDLEQLIRQWAKDNGEIHVVTGPVLRGRKHGKRVGANRVAVPHLYYKVVLDYREPDIKAIAFILKHEGSDRPLKSFAVTVNAAEEVTGFDFFPDLPDDIEETLESRLDLDKWSWDIEKSSSGKVAVGRNSKRPFNTKLTKSNLKKLGYGAAIVVACLAALIRLAMRKTKPAEKKRGKKK